MLVSGVVNVNSRTNGGRNTLERGPGMRSKSLITRHEAAVKADYQRNAGLFVFWESVWGLGMPFAMFATVVPSYMTAIGSPKIVIGIVSSLFVTLCPLQFLTSHFFVNRPRKKWLPVGYIGGIIPWLIYSFLNFAFPGLLPANLRLPVFVLVMVLFCASLISLSAPYSALVTDCTPLKKRGSLFGYRTVGVAVGLLLTSPIANWISKNYEEPRSYHLSFIVATVIYLLSTSILVFVREHRSPASGHAFGKHARTDRFLPGTRIFLRIVLRDPNYRISMFFLVLAFVAFQAGPFVITFAKDFLNITGSQVITFSIVHMLAGSVCAVAFGRIADRSGYRILGMAIGLLLTSALIIMANVTVYPGANVALVYLAFGLYASAVNLGPMILTNLSIELMPRLDKSMLIAVGNLLTLPAVLVTVPLAGFIIDLTGSYLTVFLVGAALAAVSGLGFMFLIHEPRTRKMYVVRQVRRI